MLVMISTFTIETERKYSFASAEWSQRDLERVDNVKFCRQYIVFHDDKSVVYSGASGNCTEIKGEYVIIIYFLLDLKDVNM